jgi:hypothetical protein
MKPEVVLEEGEGRRRTKGKGEQHEREGEAKKCGNGRSVGETQLRVGAADREGELGGSREGTGTVENAEREEQPGEVTSRKKKKEINYE